LEDALGLALFVEGRLRPGVVQLDDREWLDEEGRTRCALVVDDALEPPFRLSAHGDDVAAGPDRDDRLADDSHQLGRAEHGVETLPRPILGGPHPLANGRQLAGGGVQDLAGLVDAALDPLSESGSVFQDFAEIAKVAPAPGGET